MGTNTPVKGVEEMNTILLGNVVELLREKTDTHNLASWWDYFLLERLNFEGEENAHLWYDVSLQNGTDKEGKREQPLSPLEEIKGNYLVYGCAGHDNEYRITSYEYLSEVEEALLSGGGIINPFNTEMIVIENGQLKEIRPYIIIGYDDKGNEIEFQKFDNESLFDRHRPKLRNIQVLWT